MKKVFSLFLILLLNSVIAQVKIGDNPLVIGSSSLLELESTNKGVVYPRVANVAAIVTPVEGMIIYDNSTKCLRVYADSAWSSCINSSKHPSSNGTAILTNLSCGTASGTFYANQDVAYGSGTLILTVDVTRIGTYAIETVSNGITYAASGEITGTAPITGHTITLKSSGRPITAETTSFELNIFPTCSFTKVVSNNPTSNGTAVILSLTNCNYGSTGTIDLNAITANAVTQTLSITVMAPGSYAIQTPTVNGYSFAASGTFTTIGQTTVTLTASGTPLAYAENTFTLNTTPTCSFSRIVSHPTSGGTAVIASFADTVPFIGDVTYTYSSPSTQSDYIWVGGRSISSNAEARTKYLKANVTTAGTYNLTATQNGVTFSGSGTADVGAAVDVILTVLGVATPTNAGTSTFTLNSSATSNTFSVNSFILDRNYSLSYYGGIGTTSIYPTVFAGYNSNNGLSQTKRWDKCFYLPITLPSTGGTWLNNNLGSMYSNVDSPEFNPAKQATAQTSPMPVAAENDIYAYGAIYQWGRAGDGHHLMAYSISNSNLPQRNSIRCDFNGNITWVGGPSNIYPITGNPFELVNSATTNNWYSGSSLMWAASTPENSPCPSGYHVPTQSNFTSAATYIATLKLTKNYRMDAGTTFNTNGSYWTSTTSTDTNQAKAYVPSSTPTMSDTPKKYSAAVRCVKD